MPVYDIEANGKTYEVKADSPQEAYDAMLQAGLIDAPEAGPMEGIPVIDDFDAYVEQDRANLEAQLAGQQQEQARVQENIDFLESPIQDQLLATGAQVGNKTMVLPRMVLDGVSDGLNMMKTDDMPRTDMAAYLGLDEKQFVPKGSLADTGSSMIADSLMMAGGFAPVQREVAATSSTIADIFGLGMTTEGTAAAAAQAGQRAIPAMHRNADLKGLQRENVDWNNPDMVQDVIDDLNTDVGAKVNREFGGEYDAAVTAQQQALEKLRNSGLDPSSQEYIKAREAIESRFGKRMEKLEEKVGKTDYQQGYTFGQFQEDGVVEALARTYNMSRAEASEVITRNGGVNPPESFQELMGEAYRREAKNLYETQTAFSEGGGIAEKAKKIGWHDKAASRLEEALRPTVAIIRENVGAGAANAIEAAAVRAGAARHAIVAKYNATFETTQAVVEWANNPEIKRQFMDLHLTGVEGRTALIRQARESLDPESFDTFMELVEDTYKHSKDIGRRVRPDQKMDEIHWGIGKKAERPEYGSPEEVRGRINRGDNVKIGQLANRSRKSANEMTDAELEAYENPILSNFEQMFNDLDMSYIGDALDLPPSLRVGDNLRTFVRRAARHVEAVTGDKSKGANFERALDAIIVGGRKTQNPWVTAYMNQSYAGALGQTGSALLQLHDQFITAWRTSPMDALASITVDLLDANRIKPQQFGLATDAFNTREFREGLDAGFLAQFKDQQTLGERVAGGTGKAADVYFKWSGFQMFDRLGKGGNLRATYRNMQRMLKKDDGGAAFNARYGDVISPRALAEVRTAMKNGTKFDKLTPRQQDIMRDALVARLGQQQLISSASRPIAYLNNPQYRPFYAMRGFALVQQDLLKREVVDRFAQGDTKGGAEALAGYFAAVVGGYVVTDTFRDTVGAAGSQLAQTPFTGGPDARTTGGVVREQLSGEKMGERFSEGVVGPLTFNLLGDNYTNQAIKRDGLADTLIGKVVKPASGVIGELGEAASAAATGNEERMMKSLLSIVPALGRDAARAMKFHFEGDYGHKLKKRISARQEGREKEMQRREEARRNRSYR